MSSRQPEIERLTRVLGGASGPDLMVGGVSVGELSRRVSTPFYAYSGDAVRTQVRRVLRAIGPATDLIYSIKANPGLGLCQVLAGEGVGAEVASAGELLVALRAGFPPQEIFFIGPGKTDDELELALDKGIRTIIVESTGELERIESIARRTGGQAPVGIRVNPAAAVKGYGMRMGGGSQQFGVDEEQLPDLLRRFAGSAHLDIIGLQVYAGSQMFDVPALLDHCDSVVDIGLGMTGLLESNLAFIDFGGGFGVPYFENSSEFDLDAFAAGFVRIVDRCRRDVGLASARPAIELGRYLMAEAGVYVTRVVDVKKSQGTSYVVTDGGMNHHIAGTGNFGQVFRKPYPIAVVNRMDDSGEESVAVVGPNCTPLDVFAQDVRIPHVEVGDLIGVFSSGAYGYSASSLAFLSHPTPAEVMVLEGETHVLRDAGPYEQALWGQHAIDAMPANARSAAPSTTSVG